MARLRESRAAHIAPSLPMPFPALAATGIRLCLGQTSLTVAGPGVGKSQLWQNLAHRMGVPTLYWSADTDQADVTVRSLAMWTGTPVAEVELKLQDEAWRKYLFELLGKKADHIEWVFDSVITPAGVGERMNAYAEVYGRYPQLVVLDNLSNAITDPGNEYAEVKEVLAGVQKLARTAKAHIATLHHAKGEYDTGLKPIPLSGGLQNPFKVPELGITLHNRGEGHLGVNIVKHRGGKADPGAEHPIFLRKDFGISTIFDWRELAA